MIKKTIKNFPSQRSIVKCQLSSRASIALISLLVISAFTLILVLGMSEVTLSTSYQTFNNNSTQIAYYYAEACLDEAILRLEKNSTFTTTTLAMNGSGSCSITVSGTSPKIVTIQTIYLDSIQNFRAEVNLTQNGQATNATLLSWKEI